jgi:hypothetical protein
MPYVRTLRLFTPYPQPGASYLQFIKSLAQRALRHRLVAGSASRTYLFKILDRSRGMLV